MRDAQGEMRLISGLQVPDENAFPSLKLKGENPVPYILAKHRREIDALIDQLAAAILKEAKESDYDGAFAGLLNYTCTRLALKIVRQRFGRMRYWLIAMITGIFKNVADEFYRRVGVPYENQQMARNGDVDLYQDYLGELEQM